MAQIHEVDSGKKVVLKDNIQVYVIAAFNHVRTKVWLESCDFKRTKLLVPLEDVEVWEEK